MSETAELPWLLNFPRRAASLSPSTPWNRNARLPKPQALRRSGSGRRPLKKGASLPFFAGPSRWRWVVGGCRLGIKLSVQSNGRLADIEKLTAAFFHQRAGLSIETLGQFADRLDLAEQILRLAVGKTWDDVVDLRHRIIDTCKTIVGSAHDAFDQFTFAGEGGGIGLKGEQRVLYHRLVADQDTVDVVQRVPDRLDLAEIGSQHRNAITVQRHRSRGRGAAGQRYRRYPGQPLKFQANNRVLAHRRAIIDHHERDDLARVVQLEGLDLSNMDPIEIHAAAVAQTACGSFEDDPKRALLPNDVDLLKTEYADQRCHDERKRRGSDHEIACPYSHSDNRPWMGGAGRRALPRSRRKR